MTYGDTKVNEYFSDNGKGTCSYCVVEDHRKAYLYFTKKITCMYVKLIDDAVLDDGPFGWITFNFRKKKILSKYQ